MVTTVPIASLEEVRCELPIRPGNLDFDDRIWRFLNVSTAQIEKHTRRNFTKQEFVQYFSTRLNFGDVTDVYNLADWPTESSYRYLGLTRRVREQTLVLQAMPVDEGQTFEVRYSASREFDDPTSVVEATYYDLDPDTGRVFVKFGTLQSRRSTKVTFTGGYASAVDNDGNTTLTASAPEDLKMACILQTMFLYKKFDQENVGAAQNTRGKGAPVDFTKLGGLTNEAASLLVPYIRIFRGIG